MIISSEIVNPLLLMESMFPSLRFTLLDFFSSKAGLIPKNILYIYRAIIIHNTIDIIGGFYFKLRKWPILFIFGSWSLSAFVLINFYNSLLISDITASQPQPLIRSIYDVIGRDDIRLVTDRKANTNALLSVRQRLKMNIMSLFTASFCFPYVNYTVW